MKNESATHVTAIFLAAGTSSRMGAVNKLTLDYYGKKLVYHCFYNLKNSTLNQLITVTGHEPEYVDNSLCNHDDPMVHNEDYESGMTSSIQTGINAIKHDTDAYMICLADMPYLRTIDLDLLLSEFRHTYKNEPLIITPIVNERSGNPVIFSKHFKDEILSHKSPNGCKEIIKSNAKSVIKIPLENEKAFNDIDTMEDYSKCVMDHISRNN